MPHIEPEDGPLNFREKVAVVTSHVWGKEPFEQIAQDFDVDIALVERIVT